MDLELNQGDAGRNDLAGRDCAVTAQPGLARFQWLIPVAVALLVYGVGLNNFFTFDDFIWLNRARTFKQDWLQMFRPDVTYFDPLVHLMFLVDSALAGLNHYWYHAVDLAIHGANALLVYRLALLLCQERKAALYGATLFAGSFAIADAVLWSSSRVDLVATFFSLAALIQFLRFLREERTGRLYLSLVMFVLALCAKGTPLVLPALFFWLMVQEKKPLRQALCLIPFAAAVLLFFVLLKLNMHHASLPLDKLHFSIHNLALSFSALFVPESTLKAGSLAAIATVLLALVSGLGLVALTADRTVVLRRTGYLLMLLAILPVLVITELKPVGVYSDAAELLVSPSHRIYLASVGAAFMGGGLLTCLESFLSRRWPRWAQAVVAGFLALVVLVGALLVRERDRVWEGVGGRTRAAFEGLLPYRGKVPDGSQIGTIFFPGSAGFLRPMVLLALDINQVTMLRTVTLGMIEDREVLGKAEKSFLFVLDREGKVHDKTELFRQQLLVNRMALVFPDRPEIASQCYAIADQLNREIQ